MIVVVAVAVLAITAGIAALIVTLRWPRLDPASPRLTTETIAEEVGAHPAIREFLRARIRPSTATELSLTAGLVAAALGAIVVGVLVEMVHTNTGVARFDLSAANWGAAHATTGSTRILRFVNRFGSTEVTVSLALVVGFIEYRRTRTLAVFGFLISVIVGYLLIVNGTKVIVDRARPNIDRLSGFSGASFPSGHAATAAATFAALALLLGRGRTRRFKAVVAGTAVAIAVAVATTRVLLGVHWVTDVIAGLAIGWAWFALCSIAFGGRVLNFAQPLLVAKRVVERNSDDARIVRPPSQVAPPRDSLRP